MILLFINENKNKRNQTICELLNHHNKLSFRLDTLHQAMTSTMTNVTSVQPQYVYAKQLWKSNLNQERITLIR